MKIMFKLLKYPFKKEVVMLSAKKSQGIRVTGFVMFLIMGTFGITTAQTIINGDPAKLLDSLNYKVIVNPSIQYLSCDEVVSASGDELSFSNDTLRLVDRSDENNIIQYKIPKYLLKQLKYNTTKTLSKIGAGYGTQVCEARSKPFAPSQQDSKTCR